MKNKIKNKITALILLLTLTILSYSPLIIKPQTAEAAGTWVWEELTGAGQRNWMGITSSDDGMNLAAITQNGYIYTSTDGGDNWVERTGAGSREWMDIASSADGSKLFAVPQYELVIWISTNFGLTWDSVLLDNNPEIESLDLQSIAVSANGEKIVVISSETYGGGSYISNNAGESWSEIEDFDYDYLELTPSVSMSSDGMKIIAAAHPDGDSSSHRGYFITTNGGESWNYSVSNDPYPHYIRAKYSKDGNTILMAGPEVGYVRVSDNNGISWRDVEGEVFCVEDEWENETCYNDIIGADIALSSNAQIQVLLLNEVGLRDVLNPELDFLISTDGGLTFSAHETGYHYPYNSNMSQNMITISAPGTTIYAAEPSGHIWKGTYIPETFTLSFNTQGASPIPDITEDEGTSVTLPPSPTYEGYTFLNWNTQADGEGDSYQPGDSFTLNSDTTLYAIWEENPIEEQPEEQTPSEEPSRRSSSRRSVPSSLQAKNNTLNSIVLQYKDSLTTLHTLGIISLPQNILDILNIQPTNTTNTTFLRDLTLGDTGTDVSTLQSILISKGYSIPAGPTGYFGEQTRQAVAQFQRDNNITPAEGWFGVVTRGKMRGF